MLSLADIAALDSSKTVSRVYLTMGMGDAYNVSPGVGTKAWVDKVTIDTVTYDFVVPTYWYVDPTGSDSNEGTLASPFLTIQHAINTAAGGDTVNVAAGTFVENVTVNKKVTLQGAGSDLAGTIITPPSGVGITLAASGVDASDPLIVKDLRVQGASNGVQMDSAVSFIKLDNVAAVNNSNYGVEVHNSAVVNDLVLNNMTVSGNSVGLRSATSGSVNGLTITGGSFDGNVQGICIYANSGSTSNQNNFTNIAVTGTTFNNNTLKGMYFEKLDHATFTGITVNNSGTSGASSAGFDINLKYGSFQNISILNSTISNSGSGDLTNGVGLTIKARNDAPSYSGNPATLTGVTVTGGALTGNQSGLRFWRAREE